MTGHAMEQQARAAAPKIVRVDITPLEYVVAPHKAYGMARGLNARRTLALIAVEADDGTVGYGEALGPLAPIREYVSIIRPFFLGRSIFDFELIAAQIYNRLYHFGVEGHLTACLSGIDIALHDAIGKRVGVPVHDLLGGRSASVIPCYATTGYLTDDPDNGLEAQLSKVDKSVFAGVKIKIGVSPKSDRERVRRAREMLGDDILLMVDVNGNYTPDVALESLRAIEPFAIHWCEEPLPPTDVRGYAELRARSPIPIAAGEAFQTAHTFKRFIDARALDIVQPSVAACGGLRQGRIIAALAALENLRVSPSGWGGAIAVAAGLHFAASLPVNPHTDNVPYPVLLEYDLGENPLRDQLARQPIRPTKGGLEIPPGPGLGIALDPDAVERLRVKA
ncbi:MAG TPA: mandelate racemase/muconate lactonizing enzyme family protein [Xanthobacteraceae bacterium]